VSKITQNDIDALIELFDRSDWRELRVVGDGIDLFVSKDPNARRSIDHAIVASAGAAAPPVTAAPTPVAQPPRRALHLHTWSRFVPLPRHFLQRAEARRASVCLDRPVRLS